LKSNYLVLTGGLGNQLFQMAALNMLGANHQNHLDIVNGKPRLNADDKPDAMEFDIADLFQLEMKEMPLVTRKAIGYCLRSHISTDLEKTGNLLSRLARVGTGVLVSLHFRKVIRVSTLRNLGYDADFNVGKGNNLFIGYFQSSIWAPGLCDTLNETVSLKKLSPEITNYKELAKNENPLVVHVRLGDYLAEGGFGIPSHRYYAKAIAEMISSGTFGKIWLFSDEPKKAIKILPENLPVEVRVISEDNFSSAETMEVLRMGAGYVIANSTFSWWGAYLSYSLSPRVIYPRPWFRSVDPPNELTPEAWEGLNADF
jgi:hypothetical protein